jgi:hypothetical protein
MVLGAMPATAQFASPQLPPGGQITSVPTTPARSPYGSGYVNIRPVYTSGGGYPGYGGVYVQDPVSGFYNGVANLTSAYGQYIQDYQQARLLNQDVERSKLSTRRMLIEQQEWEQARIPKAEDVRRYKMEQELRRAINDPPVTEIFSADALNILLRNVKDMQAKGGYGPLVSIDKETLEHINLTVTAGANIALFKDGGKLRWPFALRDTPFDKDREQAQDLVYKALKETEADELSPATQRQLKATIGNMDKALERMGPEMSIPDSIQARRYVDELSRAVTALEHRTASDSLKNKKVTPQARTVGDLVLHMTKNGQQFAPALQGEEGPYRALYQGLVTHSFGTMQSMRK